MLRSPASLFEIPHIIDLICEHLSLNDIWTCLRVSRSWQSLWGPHQWKNVYLTRCLFSGAVEPFLLDAHQRDKIRRHARFIQVLRVNILEGEVFLVKEHNSAGGGSDEGAGKEVKAMVMEETNLPDENHGRGKDNGGKEVAITGTESGSTLSRTTLCTHLKSLMIIGERWQPWTDEQRIVHKARQTRLCDLSIPSPLQLVASNYHLETLHLTCIGAAAGAFQKWVLPALSSLKLLKSWSLDVGFDFDPVLVQRLLMNCPGSVESLSLKFDTLGDTFRDPRPDRSQGTEEPNDKGKGERVRNSGCIGTTWRELPNLTRLDLGEYLNGWDEWLLLPLLNHTPNLEDFTCASHGLEAEVMSVLATQCPNLSKVYFNCDQDAPEGGTESQHFGVFESPQGSEAATGTEMPLPSWRHEALDPADTTRNNIRLFNPHEQTLRMKFTSVRLNLGRDSQHQFLPALFQTSAHSLTSLILQSVRYLTSQDLLLIFRKFPNLESFWFSESYYGIERLPLSRIEIQDLIHAQFACKNIKEISLPLSDARDRNRTPYELGHPKVQEHDVEAEEPQDDQEAQTARLLQTRQESISLIHQLFHHMKSSLPHLERFYCSWTSLNFIMPEDVGIALLEETGMTEADIFWMGLQWIKPPRPLSSELELSNAATDWNSLATEVDWGDWDTGNSIGDWAT